MAEIIRQTINQKLARFFKVGLHYGHKKKEWNPKMVPFLFYSFPEVDREHHFINLYETQKYLNKACRYLRAAAIKKKIILFVGTKRRLATTIQQEAMRCGAFYVNYRWLGGMLTNWKTIQKRIRRLKVLETLQAYGILNYYPKKESAKLKRELEKLNNYLIGIKNMPCLPDVVVLIDQEHELTAIKECKTLNIPIISIIDTNSNPDLVDLGIPGNDDSVKAIRYILQRLARAIGGSQQEFNPSAQLV
uniref:Small ribosomal subunit protein uS2c n=1 Tax=Vischeria sp. CAUP Q 202 TaxID=1805947 RepID=A0A1D8RDU4_9STRA|nr:ribosomal protein S2 [Vischeria punctata]AOW70898.1 ribosomal protein S2 [Vischeria sp. CAUP Q 202]UTV00903.1 ribosomal protein S2 [Vischeria punctata]